MATDESGEFLAAKHSPISLDKEQTKQEDVVIFITQQGKEKFIKKVIELTLNELLDKSFFVAGEKEIMIKRIYLCIKGKL